MPVLQLPEFEQVLSISSGLLDTSELSECHGIACGVLSRQPRCQADEYLQLLAGLELLSNPAADLSELMGSLFRATASQLEDDQLRLGIWLPPDEESLEVRTLSLAAWCNGYLAGLASCGNFGEDTLSEEVTEALSDIEQIARAEMTGDGEAEEEEGAFMEITEYVRVVTYMMREELSPPGDSDRVH
jgi:uncharacterized protein YgfB (UPF0149 family)